MFEFIDFLKNGAVMAAKGIILAFVVYYLSIIVFGGAACIGCYALTSNAARSWSAEYEAGERAKAAASASAAAARKPTPAAPSASVKKAR